MENEKWVTIEDYPNYEVSDKGNIRFTNNNGVKEILNVPKGNRGYDRVRLESYMGNTHRSVHRLVAEYFVPNQDNKSQVNHKDGVKTNNKASNLEWVTAKENVEHAFDTKLRQDNNFVTVYDQNEDKTLNFRSVHQAAKHLNISDEAVTVWKVRSEYVPIDGRYIIKEIMVRKPKDSTPLYVYDHVDDIYTDYVNRMDFVLNTGLSPYTVLERLRKYKQLSHYIAGYTVSEKELKDVERKKSALEDRMKLFSKPVVKTKMSITIRLNNGDVEEYESLNKFIEKYPYVTPVEAGVALAHGKVDNCTYMCRGLNIKYTDLDTPFTLYNEYQIENSINGLRFDVPVYKLTYSDDILLIRRPANLGKILNTSRAAALQRYKKNKVILIKDRDGKDVVVERVS